MNVLHPLTPVLRDVISLLDGQISVKVAANIHHVYGHAEEVFNVRDQRSRACVYKCVNATVIV